MDKEFKDYKVALVHDWLTNQSGSDKVLTEAFKVFNNPDVYCLFSDSQYVSSLINGQYITNTYLQNFFRYLPHKVLTPLMPTAIESINLQKYDLVLTTGAAFSNGVVTGVDTIHINYCHSPTRQLWDDYYQHSSRGNFITKPIRTTMLHLSRLWDYSVVDNVDYFVTNSNHVADRISKYYGRQAHVIYPPVRIGETWLAPNDDGYYLIVSRLYKHKNIEIAIKAFNKLGYNLVVIGEGPEFRRLRKIAGSNILMRGAVSDDELWQYYSKCSVFVMPQEEDFGIAGVEAMSFGKPVLALSAGGALEFIQENFNGLFFNFANEEVLADGVRRIHSSIANFNGYEIRKSIMKFSNSNFRSNLAKFVQTCL